MINRWPYINGYAMVFPKGFEKSLKLVPALLLWKKIIQYILRLILRKI